MMDLLRAIGRWLVTIVPWTTSNDAPPSGLPDDWPEQFEEAERDYLYDESRRRLAETMEFANQQEVKAYALVRIAILVIAASGIFGDLQIEIASPQEWEFVTMASTAAMVASIAVGVITFWLLRPRDWETGADVTWLAAWSYASERQMKDEVVRILVKGFRRNREHARQKGRQLKWLLLAVSVQTVCVVAVEVLAAVEASRAMD